MKTNINLIKRIIIAQREREKKERNRHDYTRNNR
jgi:hypothetical protein